VDTSWAQVDDRTSVTTWTNRSVLRLAGTSDPVDAITAKAHELVTAAFDRGWKGPPYDPFLLAELQQVDLLPREDVRDARTVPLGSDGIRIEFNPNRPRSRVRYSIAHELGHALFPDCAQHVRNRALYHELVRDEWQLEALCNVAAAELLMPMGSFPELGRSELNIDRMLELRREYDVSTEALLIRTIRITPDAGAMFCASRVTSEEGPRYRIDYSIGSGSWPHRLPSGLRLPNQSLAGECSAIGYTAKGNETWGHGLPTMHIECVALPPYPGGKSPRIAGLALTPEGEARTPCITALRGDALIPRAKEPCLLAHVVNDTTASWGGRGFARGVRERWPQVQEDFRSWATEKSGLPLGEVHFANATPEITIASMVAQHGYGPSDGPRIRYAALQRCLRSVALHAADASVPVQMPRIAMGYGGGAWEIVEELITQAFCPLGVPVTVYELPP
jgi:O-acetyl-ADP-ribose deacetylase (regulator of RNase III)